MQAMNNRFFAFKKRLDSLVKTLELKKKLDIPMHQLLNVIEPCLQNFDVNSARLLMNCCKKFGNLLNAQRAKEEGKPYAPIESFDVAQSFSQLPHASRFGDFSAVDQIVCFYLSNGGTVESLSGLKMQMLTLSGSSMQSDTMIRVFQTITRTVSAVKSELDKLEQTAEEQHEDVFYAMLLRVYRMFFDENFLKRKKDELLRLFEHKVEAVLFPELPEHIAAADGVAMGGGEKK